MVKSRRRYTSLGTERHSQSERERGKFTWLHFRAAYIVSAGRPLICFISTNRSCHIK